MNRPNVLLIMVDQLAAQWLPAYGHSVVHAPVLTDLAERGVVFDAAYCASPLRAPSRAALMCGRRASALDVFDNAAELRASVPTLAHWFRAAGYRTCLAGKMHFVGPDQLHGFERRLLHRRLSGDSGLDAGLGTSGGGSAALVSLVQSVLEPGRTTASLQTDYDDEVAFHAVRYVHELARARGGSDDPFFLTVSFTIRTTRGRCRRATGTSTTRRRSRFRWFG